jgi:hypothetical protein
VSGIRRGRLRHENHFTITPNAWCRDERLSLKARGLLTLLLSHSEGWVITMDSLIKSNREGRAAIRAAVAELVEHGYLKRIWERGDDGRMAGSNYVLTDPDEDHAPAPAEPDTDDSHEPEPTADEDETPSHTERPETATSAESAADDFPSVESTERREIAPHKKNNPSRRSSTTEEQELRGAAASAAPGDVPAANDQQPQLTAQTLVTEWIDHCSHRPPDRVIGQTSKEIRLMLDQGIAYELVRVGVQQWQLRGLHPSALASVVHEVMNHRPAPRVSRREQETQDLFSDAFAWAAEQDAQKAVRA